MSLLERSLARLRARPVEASFSDVQRVLSANGWTMRNRSGTSHVVFTKSGQSSFTVPLRGRSRVARVYVEQLLERLGNED